MTSNVTNSQSNEERQNKRGFSYVPSSMELQYRRFGSLGFALCS